MEFLPFLPFCSLLVYHRYTDVNIGLWRVRASLSPSIPITMNTVIFFLEHISFMINMAKIDLPAQSAGAVEYTDCISAER